ARQWQLLVGGPNDSFSVPMSHSINYFNSSNDARNDSLAEDVSTLLIESHDDSEQPPIVISPTFSIHILSERVTRIRC
ncbi:hypothetical protein HAX54_011909, partial [Datura stramonium]|nr:hypothetical protein [Datura stramonium]